MNTCITDTFLYIIIVHNILYISSDIVNSFLSRFLVITRYYIILYWLNASHRSTTCTVTMFNCILIEKKQLQTHMVCILQYVACFAMYIIKFIELSEKITKVIKHQIMFKCEKVSYKFTWGVF